MLLGRLEKAGLVEYAPSAGSSRWRLSAKGLHGAKLLAQKIDAIQPDPSWLLATTPDPIPAPKKRRR